MASQREPPGWRVRLSRAAALALLAALPATAGAAESALRAQRPRASPLQVHVEAKDGSWHVRVFDSGGVERQRLKVATDAPELPPRIVDADGDGAGDLWLPVIAGNANTTFELWRMQPTRTRFTRAGEVSGSVFTLDDWGYLIASGRSGCCATEHVFHRFAHDGALVPAFTITRQLDPAVPLAEACVVTPDAVKPAADLVARICTLGVESPLPGKRLPVN